MQPQSAIDQVGQAARTAIETQPSGINPDYVTGVAHTIGWLKGERQDPPLTLPDAPQ